MPKGLLFVITAPSGCGKGTLRKALLAENPDIAFCPSVTTRPARPGEINGVDYYFVPREEFDRMKEAGELAEWAEVYGNMYGTPAKEIEDKLAQGFSVIIEKDVQGARTLREVYPEGVFIFVLPTSMEELRRRMLGRGTESEQEREKRLRSAEREMADLSAFDYVIINADLNRAKERLSAIVSGELARSGRPVLPEGQRRSPHDQHAAGGAVDGSPFEVQPGHRRGKEGQADCGKEGTRRGGSP